ncbi:MAG: hypothetical protein U9N36_05775 [Euryarchaeota archaeon]|nr:hypothetical protein [Euryarchaeota archaeon]
MNWSIVSVSCLMIVSVSIVFLEDYYSNNIEVLWSRMGFRSIWKNSGVGGYAGELNTYKDTKFQFLYSTTTLVLECDIVRNDDAKMIIKRIITPPVIAEMVIVHVAMSVLCQ